MSITPGRELLVLHLDDLPSQIAVSVIPPTALMAEHLNVNSLLVHELQPRRAQNQRTIVVNEPGEVRVFNDVQFFRENEMTVYVDNFHSTLSNKHFTTF